MATSITVGNIPASQRPAVTETWVRSSLALRNRSVSWRSVTKARTTRTPVICSRSSRFTSSIRTCISRKLGTIRLTMNPIDSASTGTIAATSHDRPASTWMAITMPPTIMIGADTMSVPPISTSICTCWTSLVSRVISDGGPNCCTSRAEKDPTRAKIAARRSRPKPIALRAENQTAPMEQATWTSVTPSITAPRRRIRPVSPLTTPRSMMSALRLGR